MIRVKLKDVASFAKGQQISGDVLLSDGEYDYLNGGVTPSGKWMDYNAGGDCVTISEGGNSCGFVNYMTLPFWCGAHCYHLYDLKCKTKYLFYALKSQQDRIKALRSGACMPNIKKKDLGEFEFSFEPSTKKQTEAIQCLDAVSNLIALRKQQLAKLDGLVKARFMEMFGTDHNLKKTKLETISEFVTVGIANSATHAYSDAGIAMFRNQNIKENYLDDSDLIYIKPEFAALYPTKKLKENDILVIRTGYPGIACLVPAKYEGCQTFTTLIVRLKRSRDFIPLYICHYINSQYGKAFVDEMKVGVAQQNFGAKSLEKMPILIPPIEKQWQFVSQVKQISKSKLTIQQGLDKLEVLEKSLMQQYFG